MKRLLFFVCTLLFANVLSAQFCEGDLYYEVKGTGKVQVGGCCNPSATFINIPSSVTYQGTTYSVTSIGSYAFYSCNSLTSVTIGNSVTSIEEGAFWRCISLTSVTIGNSVTSIGYSAFEECISLTSVTIPNSVTSIGRSAFCDCSSLTSVDIPNSVASIGSYAFYSCNSLTSVTIPNSVTFIDDWAFGNCSSLTSIGIPFGVTSIGEDAFAGCSSLTSVAIPNSITSIGGGAFNNCSSLTSVTIPNSVTYIGDWAFFDCSSLTSVTCLATNPPYLNRRYYVFYDIGSPSTLYVPNGCRQAYENSAWAQWFDCIVELGSGATSVNLNVEVNNEEWGHVEVDEGCGNATLTAVADNDCSDFWRWSDGNSNNPRVINVSSDTSITAIFTDPVFDTTIHATIAQGETYLLNGQELSQSGVYSANVLSEAGCEIYLTLVLDVIATDNIGANYSSLSQTSLESLSLKPNPTKGLIEFGQRIDKVAVIDISGKRIESFFDANQINISHLPAGVYHLELQCGDETVVRKIVKE